jgi:hypothetical protein
MALDTYFYSDHYISHLLKCQFYKCRLLIINDMKHIKVLDSHLFVFGSLLFAAVDCIFVVCF